MKVEMPSDFFFRRKVSWNKTDFFLNISIYSGFALDSNEWLDKETLLNSLNEITESKIIIDNGLVRKFQEYFIYDKSSDVQKYCFKMLDAEKIAPKKNFLPLTPEDANYKTPKGTFDEKWLSERWPALPDDCDDSTSQLAMDDQWFEDEWDWGDSFYLKKDFNIEYSQYSLPSKEIKGFYKEIDSDEKKDLELKPDVLSVNLSEYVYQNI